MTIKCKIHKCTEQMEVTGLRVCKRHYSLLYAAAHSTKRVKPGTVCEMYSWCGEPATRYFRTIEHGCIETGGFYCDEHHSAAVSSLFGNTGAYGKYRYFLNGYIVLADKTNHPLVTKKGLVLEHRYVVYEDQKGVCTPCFWCGVSLTWRSACIDHLDENKINNERSNLVTSCNDCNRARGSMFSFVGRMREDAVPWFFDQILKYRSLKREV